MVFVVKYVMMILVEDGSGFERNIGESHLVIDEYVTSKLQTFDNYI